MLALKLAVRRFAATQRSVSVMPSVSKVLIVRRTDSSEDVEVRRLLRERYHEVRRYQYVSKSLVSHQSAWLTRRLPNTQDNCSRVRGAVLAIECQGTDKEHTNQLRDT